jgi:hypothetical protein
LKPDALLIVFEEKIHNGQLFGITKADHHGFEINTFSDLGES